MSYENVAPGKNVPEDINVIIEIPAHADPVKYEVDKDSGAMIVDRFMGTAMHYPCNYGYVPHTLCGDGDPADVLVITPFPLITGSVVRCRPVGVLKMTDESGEDAKLLAVPISKLTPMYDNVNEPGDVSPVILDQISHFFEHYKDLEPGKWVRIDGWEGAAAARAEIKDAVARHQPGG
ncbi:inorganic diphosphatase [Arhodomonas sp. SL1]|uniref:inorganic diphosphatase n=1 Tax=Arhodomonas sp. SL1 TaxID=3425691 RepID=UPI003F882FD1